MLIIGLVGKIGTGKTTVAWMLQKLGAEYIALDEIGHLLLKSKTVKREIVNSFGKQILNPANEIDRRKLADIVFSNRKKLLLLNRIIHPRMFREVKRRLKEIRLKNSRPVVVIEGAVLFEAKISSLVNKIVMVTSPKNLILRRMMKQGKFLRKDVLQRLNSQRGLDRARKKAHYLIKNTGSLSDLQKSVQFLWQEITGF